MRKYIFAIIFIFFCVHSFGQQEVDGTNHIGNIKKQRRPVPMPAIFLGISTGINNSSGALGFDLNIPVASSVTLDGGMGASTWGNKLFFGGKYYLRPHCRGWAFGGGFTFNTGQQNRKMNLETFAGKEKVTLSLNPQSNVFIAAYHYWTLGRRNNRFYIAAGDSSPLQECRFHQVYGDTITPNSYDRVKRMCPGGLMLATGFSFCIRNK